MSKTLILAGGVLNLVTGTLFVTVLARAVQHREEPVQFKAAA